MNTKLKKAEKTLTDIIFWLGGIACFIVSFFILGYMALMIIEEGLKWT